MMQNKGCFMLNSKFQIVLLFAYKTESDMQKMKGMIPHSGKMRKLIIEKEDEVDGSMRAANTLKELNKVPVHFVKKEGSASNQDQL